MSQDRPADEANSALVKSLETDYLNKQKELKDFFRRAQTNSMDNWDPMIDLAAFSPNTADPTAFLLLIGNFKITQFMEKERDERISQLKEIYNKYQNAKNPQLSSVQAPPQENIAVTNPETAASVNPEATASVIKPRPPQGKPSPRKKTEVQAAQANVLQVEPIASPISNPPLQGGNTIADDIIARRERDYMTVQNEARRFLASLPKNADNGPALESWSSLQRKNLTGKEYTEELIVVLSQVRLPAGPPLSRDLKDKFEKYNLAVRQKKIGLENERYLKEDEKDRRELEKLRQPIILGTPPDPKILTKADKEIIKSFHDAVYELKNPKVDIKDFFKTINPVKAIKRAVSSETKEERQVRKDAAFKEKNNKLFSDRDKVEGLADVKGKNSSEAQYALAKYYEGVDATKGGLKEGLNVSYIKWLVVAAKNPKPQPAAMLDLINHYKDSNKQEAKRWLGELKNLNDGVKVSSFPESYKEAVQEAFKEAKKSVSKDNDLAAVIDPGMQKGTIGTRFVDRMNAEDIPRPKK